MNRREHADPDTVASATAQLDREFLELTRKISRDRGFACASYKEKCLRRRIAVRMRARGVHTHEFRLDAGGSRYPELVFVTTRAMLRAHREKIHDALAVLDESYGPALDEPGRILRAIAKAGQIDPVLLRAEYKAIRPALLTGVRFSATALRHWAAFDVRYGILRRPPDLRRAFDMSLWP